jgi:pimeloyl-ACP methyl ester carboxylesterase
MLIALFRLVVPITLVALTPARPASAQGVDYSGAEYTEGEFGPERYAGTYARDFARYYAPYALQAAGAYLPVSTMDQARRLDDAREARGEARGGEDAKRVADYAIKVRNADEREDLIKKARKYLGAWRYAFGSEKYLDCYEDDPDCLKSTRAGWRVKRFLVGPAFHVWTRTAAGPGCSEASIAFRGTDDATWARYFTDRISSFDTAVAGFTDNTYRQLQRNINAILRKIAALGCTQIVSVGHSLGAGLGQLAALATSPENRKQGLGINKVFAFDASPVIGTSYVAGNTQEANAHVEIDLVYQNQEALEALRGDSTAPCLRTVRIDALKKTSRTRLHNMAALARETVRMSYKNGAQLPYELPVPLPRCDKSFYTRPTTDEDFAPQPPASSAPVAASAPGTRTTSLNRSRVMDSFAMGDGFVAAPAPELFGSAAPVSAKRPDAGTRKARKLQPPAQQFAVDAGWPQG